MSAIAERLGDLHADTAALVGRAGRTNLLTSWASEDDNLTTCAMFISFSMYDIATMLFMNCNSIILSCRQNKATVDVSVAIKFYDNLNCKLQLM